eukprot:CAMPEP_0206012774 /NCGR_PEP_ID=MMETSP1464-20131121/15391_1 /ASSEMBLY_ACC=CAM_ASM_001124 /TAXON_ID=119497 /ORGANISM="Exanthemachrysis gayraliae, Strain RCC1523" /LENGTH=161 /DNA_ID=CAMNT_0053386469 /DNA_START=202 /DNA_END=684 /DNA_ORIENTATION=+
MPPCAGCHASSMSLCTRAAAAIPPWAPVARRRAESVWQEVCRLDVERQPPTKAPSEVLHGVVGHVQLLDGELEHGHRVHTRLHADGAVDEVRRELALRPAEQGLDGAPIHGSQGLAGEEHLVQRLGLRIKRLAFVESAAGAAARGAAAACASTAMASGPAG